MTKLRQLAKQYSEGALDEETYRSAREDFITQITRGVQPLEANEYLPPVSEEDAEGGNEDVSSPAVFVLDEEYAADDGPSDLVRGLCTLAAIVGIVAILVFGIRLL